MLAKYDKCYYIRGFAYCNNQSGLRRVKYIVQRINTLYIVIDKLTGIAKMCLKETYYLFSQLVKIVYEFQKTCF